MSSLRKTVVDRVPAGTAVISSIDAAFIVKWLVTGIVPFFPDTLPSSSVESAIIGRVHDQVDRPGPLADVKDLLPGLTAVGSLVDTTLGIVGPFVPGCRNVHDVGIRWMHDNSWNREGRR